MNIRSLVTTAIIALIAVASTAQASDRHVPASYPTIQAGIDAASDGDTVIIAPGTYTGNGNRDISFTGKAITVRSANGAASCTIDCQGSEPDWHRGFVFEGGEESDSVLEGITITRGVSYIGGAIYCDQSSPTIRNCEFRSNSGRDGGGSIGCLFSSPDISDCVFAGNIASWNGGGGIYSMSGSTLRIDGCIFKNNSGGVGGSVLTEYASEIDIINCVFTGNTAEMGGALLVVDASTVNMVNCLIMGNTAVEGEGVIFVHSEGGLSLTNSIVRNNRVINPDHANEIITFWSPSTNVSYCNIEGGLEVAGNLEPGSGWGDGNIDVDPMFFESGYWDNEWFDGIYYLKPDSPCIDTGFNNTAVGRILEDIDGAVRPLDGDGDSVATVDMGVYERGSEAKLVVSDERISIRHFTSIDEPLSEKFSLVNIGDGTFEWEISANQPWVELSSRSGTNLGSLEDITVTVNPDGMAVGEYECELVIHLPGDDEPLVSVRVVLTIEDELLVPQKYATIQDAIDVAVDGVTVLVADGVYGGYGNSDVDFKGKAITVRSENGPESCVVDGSLGGERGFVFTSGEGSDSVLSGFTISKFRELWEGNPESLWYNDQGVAIAILDSSPTIEDCRIVENISRYENGIKCPIICLNSNVVIRGCTISDNDGDGISYEGGSPVIDNCSIMRNSGSGIRFVGSDALVTNSKIVGNDNPSKFSNNDPYNISRNWDGYGGGILSDDSNINVVACLIGSNRARTGAAVFKIYGQARFSSCIFEDNRSNNNYLYYSQLSGSDWTFENCVILGHDGDLFSGGENTVLQNCVISFDINAFGNPQGRLAPRTPIGDLSQNITINYCCLDGVSGNIDGVGNIEADPMFVRRGSRSDANCNGEWVAGDYHLLFGSPCIDSGSEVIEGDYGGFDIEGKERPIDGDNDGVARVDIGAYEAGSLDEPMLGVSEQVVDIFVDEYGERTSHAEIEVFNRGVGVLDWSVEGDGECEWLSVSKESDDGADKIVLEADGSGLEWGRYQCDLTVNEGDAVFSPLVITVYLSVNREHYVPDDFETIQAAVDAAVDGDVITVADGVYGGVGNQDVEFMGKTLTVRSANGAGSCVIDCGISGGDHRGFWFHNDEDERAIVDGFTITNAVSPVLIKTSTNCNGSTSTSYTYHGGAIRCDYASPTIQNCIIIGNEGGYGGGAYIKRGNPEFINCVFESNSAGDGGGVLCDGGNATFDRCCFNFNSSWGNWKTVYMNNGGVYQNVRIDLPAGGGLSVSSGSTRVSNCIFLGNEAKNYGGGALRFSESDVVVSNCTFAGNRASGEGSFGGVCFDSDPDVFQLDDPAKRVGDNMFRNCIFWGNANDDGLDRWETYAELDELPFRVDYSCVQGMTVWLGLGNFDADPLFVDAGYWHDGGTAEDYIDDIWHAGDYHLQSAGWRWDDLTGQWTWDGVTSLCIDAGNPGMVLADEPTTIEVDPLNRFGVNKRINMGAYGGTSQASMAPPGFALLADITNDGTVDIADLAILMQSWLTTEQNSYADFTRDAKIDFADFALLAQDWLLQTTWFTP